MMMIKHKTFHKSNGVCSTSNRKRTMCILFLYIGDEKNLTFIASNRDEYFIRPTKRGQLYPVPSSSSRISSDRQQSPQVSDIQWRYIPYDQEGGGTWLSFQHVKGKGLRFAVVLNYHLFRDEVSTAQPPESELVTRGKLVLDFMNNNEQKSLAEYAHDIFEQRGRYRPFNLILFDESEAANKSMPTCYYVSSSQYQTAPSILHPGSLYGITNGYMDVEWDKVKVGKALLHREVVSKLSGASQEIRTTTATSHYQGDYCVVQHAKRFSHSAKFEQVTTVVEKVLAVLNDSHPLPDPTFSAALRSKHDSNDALPDVLLALEELAAIHVPPTIILPEQTFLANGELNAQKYQTLAQYCQSTPTEVQTDHFVFGTRTSTVLLYQHAIRDEESDDDHSRFVIVAQDLQLTGQHSEEDKDERISPVGVHEEKQHQSTICSINLFSNFLH